MNESDQTRQEEGDNNNAGHSSGVSNSAMRQL